MAITNKAISSWVRQARYRAKRHGIYSDLEVTDVQGILQAAAQHCSYCQVNDVDALDCPFPLKEGGPNVPANVVPCCRTCKTIKNNHDVVWMFTNSQLPETMYLALLRDLFARRGGDLIKEHVRRATGMIDMADG